MSDDYTNIFAEANDPWSATNWRESGREPGMYELIKAEERSRDADPDWIERGVSLDGELAKNCYILNREGRTCQFFYSTPFMVFLALCRVEPIATVNCTVNNEHQAVFTTDRDPQRWPYLYPKVEEMFDFSGMACAHCGKIILGEDDTMGTEQGAFHADCYEALSK